MSLPQRFADSLADRLRSRFFAASLAAVSLLIAARSRGQESSIGGAVEALPGNCTTIVFVNDPLPRIEAVLGSPGLQQALGSEGLGMFPGRSAVDLQAIRAQVVAQSHFIPREAAFGVPAASWVDIAQSCRAGLLLALCSGANEVGAIDERATFQRELGAAVERLALPTVFVTAAFRKEDTAAGLLQGAAAMAEGLKGFGASVESSEGALTVSASVGDWMLAEGIAPMLEQFGLQGDHAEAPTLAIAKSLAKISLEARLEQHGDVLRLSIVGRPHKQSSGLSLRSLGPLWKPGDALLGHAKWDISAFQRAWLLLAKEWSEWESTAAGKHLIAQDSEDALAMFRVTEQQLASWASKGSAVATYDKTLDATVQAQGAARAKPLSESDVNGFFPPDALTMIADSTRSLSDFAVAQFDEIEGRLALRSLDSSPRGETFRTLSSKFYDTGAPLRKLIYDESPAMFEPPLAIIATNQGRLEDVGFAVRESAGNSFSKSLANRNVSEVALIGRMKQGSERAKDFYQELYRGGLALIASPGERAVVEVQDLGLGCPTSVFRPVFWELAEVKGQITAKGDLLPHYFVIDQWLVFSTSPRLSKAMLAARASESPLVSYPKLKEPIVAMGRISSESYAQLIYDLETMLMLARPNHAARPAGGGPPDHDGYIAEINKIRDPLHAMAEVVRLMRDVRWFTTENDQRRETRAQVRFVD